MHINEIARELQITAQELRHELQKTNFGISSTAHEVDDGLAVGIVRFLKGKIKPTLSKRRVAVVDKEGNVQEILPEEEVIVVEEEEKKEEKKSRVMIIKKSGRVTEENNEEEVVVEEEVKEEKKEEDKEEVVEKKSKRKQAFTIRKVPKRSVVPKQSPVVKGNGKSLSVSRRIELDKNGKKTTTTATTALPKKYYKSKKKGRRKYTQEEQILETMQRHPGRKVRIAKVSYETGEGIDNRSAEEIAMEREMDKEHFKEQKKHRAISQKRGPKAQPQIKTKTGVVEIPSIISVKEFSEKCGVPVTKVISALLKNGIMATINQQLDYDTAEIISVELGVEIKKKREEATSKDLFEGDVKKLLAEEDKKKLKVRPPIISIMGHVDHGKTKLLDYIRKANVVDTEAGGITQHIGAYQVKKKGHLITFLDTPGHEAFTSMRARGAKATDIAILVVAADEGVKPQTVEAINHAKEAGIPIIVAINKIDKPNANPEKVKGELVEHGLQSEDWGGKTIMAPVSAITGEGVDELLEMILLVAEMESFKANPNRMAVGTVIESHLDKSLGPVATILVNTGTLKIGDNMVVGTTVGKVKAMHDHKGMLVKKIPPSGAVRISGLETVPQAGDILQVYKTEKIARARAEELQSMMVEREESLGGSMVERIVSQINTGEMKYLKIVLKADTKGSLEAIMQALHKIKTHDVAVKVIHFGVGNITDTDVVMASASQALLVGFHVKANIHVQKMAYKEHLDIRPYTIIYKLIEDVKAYLSGMLEPDINVIELGKITLKEIFLDKKKWAIVGGTVTEGKAQSGSMVRLMRGKELLFESKLGSLKHVKEDVNELEKGSDCGIKIDTPVPIEPGDVAEVFKIEKVERTLD